MSRISIARCHKEHALPPVRRWSSTKSMSDASQCSFPVQASLLNRIC
ncbi:hypothetical protein LINPERPRIM_LOCUS30546 [Linum perenne]